MRAARSKIGFTIEVGCPGCGGELELEENFFVLSCSHCGSFIRIVKPDIPVAYLIKGKLRRNQVRFHVDRFLKKRKLPLTESGVRIKNLYYPYWKIDAMVAKVRNRYERRQVSPPSEYEVAQYREQEKSEISIAPFTATVAAGNRMDGIPLSIGIRTEYIKLFPYSDEEIQDSFDSLPIVRTNDDSLADVALKFASVNATGINSTGINKTDLFDPIYSIIFFPFHVVELVDSHGYSRYLLDGVTGRILHHQHPLDKDKCDTSPLSVLGLDSPLAADLFGEETNSLNTGLDDSSTDDLFTDLEKVRGFSEAPPIEFGALGVEFHRCPNCGEDLPGRQSYVYICRNCHEKVMLEPPPVPVSGIANTAVDKGRMDRLFPFWSFMISENNDITVKRLFAGVFDSDHLVIPAFTIANMEAVYRLARRMSSAVPKLELNPTGDVDGRFMPVDVGPNQALTIARLVIYRALLSRNQSNDPEDVRFQPAEVSLIFASFHPESYFYVDSVLGAVTFEKNLVC
jgi:hypothetical protein